MNTILCLVILGATGIFATKSPEEGNMVEGDMEMDPEQMSAYFEQMGKTIGSDDNAFAAIKSKLWLTNGKADVIKYYIDPKLDIPMAKSAIYEAITEYHRYTCITFRNTRVRPSGPHIFFTTGNGCSSPVGRSNSVNTIRLGGGCWRKGIVMHEIGHSIGLFHEQSRPDRDDYVTIRWENIHEGMKYNFNKMKTSNWAHHDTTYDYDSMMHYGSKYFSQNGEITIETKHSYSQNRIGNRRGFSDIDIIQIKRMYRCNAGGGGNRGSSCQDEDSGCSGWKSFCSNDDYVKRKCKKTCGTCGGSGSSGGNCRDIDEDCQNKIKGCGEWGESWKNWMETNCKKTCNFC